MKFSTKFTVPLNAWAFPIAFSSECTSDKHTTYIDLDILIVCFLFEFSVSYEANFFRGFWNLTKLVASIILFIIGFTLSSITLKNISLLLTISVKIIGITAILSSVSLIKMYPYEKK